MKKNNSSQTFGSYIRILRTDLKIGQRELAKKISIAPSYLNDIEKNKRAAPKTEIIKKISLTLKADLDLLNDLAGKSKKTLPPDINDYLEKNPKIISLIRSIKNNNLNIDDLEKIEISINKNKTKCLIVAAGLGSRLKGHTEHNPKCMLDFGGKTLLQRQLLSYKDNGIEDISLIRGYKKNKINYHNLIRFLSNF